MASCRLQQARNPEVRSACYHVAHCLASGVLVRCNCTCSFALQEPGCKNSEGNTPLHYACLNGHVAIVRQLMMNGASASELNRSGNRSYIPPHVKRPIACKAIGSSSSSM